MSPPFSDGPQGGVPWTILIRQSGRTVAGWLAATAFLIAAVLAIVVEASFLISDAGQTPLVVVMVVALPQSITMDRYSHVIEGWTGRCWNA